MISDQVKNVISAFCGNCDVSDNDNGRLFCVHRHECPILDTLQGLDAQFPQRGPWGVVLESRGVVFLDKSAKINIKNTHTLKDLVKHKKPWSETVVACRGHKILEGDPRTECYKYVPVGEDKYKIEYTSEKKTLFWYDKLNDLIKIWIITTLIILLTRYIMI